VETVMRSKMLLIVTSFVLCSISATASADEGGF
jgi:hypothetical protein